MADAVSTPSVPSSASPQSTPSTPAQSTSGHQETAPSKSPTEQAASSASAPEMFEVKVNGRTVKMSRQEVLDHASMSHAANDKFNEAKKLRADYEKDRGRVKKDFMEYITDPELGLSKDQIRARIEEWYNKEYIEPEGLSEDQRKIKEYEAKVKKYEDQEKSLAEQKKQQEEDTMTSKQREYLQGQIIEALEKSNLPKTKATVQRIAFHMRQNNLNGWNAPMDFIINQVKNERQGNFRDEIQNSSAEQIIELLGDEFINKIRRHDLENLRKSRQAPPVQSAPRAGTGEVGNEKISYQDVNERLQKMRLGQY